MYGSLSACMLSQKSFLTWTKLDFSYTLNWYCCDSFILMCGQEVWIGAYEALLTNVKTLNWFW